MLIESLVEIKEKELYASIYADLDNTSRFLFGKVPLLNDDHLIIESYSPNGQDDGFVLLEVKNVYKTEINSKYSQKMMALINHHNCSNHEKIDIKETNHSLVEHLLLFSQLKKYIVSIELLGNGVMFLGLVDSIQNELCCIKQIDEYGEDDGVTYIDILDISMITCNGEEEKYLKILNDI